MTSGFAGWMAGVREYRLALFVSIAGSLALILLLVVPSWFLPTPSSTENHTSARSPAYSLPSRPAQTPAVKSQIDSAPLTSLPVPQKTEKKIVSEVKKSPPKASHPQPSPAMTHLTKSKHSLKHGYYVQTGAFRDAYKAEKLARQLQQSGWNVQTIIKKNILHAVLVGPWPTRARAQNGKQQLAHKNKLKGFIVQQ